MNTPWKEKLQFVILSSPSSSLHFLFILDNHMFKRRRKTWEGHTLYFFSTQIGDLCRFQKQFTLSLYQNRNVWHFYTFTQLSLFCDHKRNQNMAYIWQLGMRWVKKIDSRLNWRLTHQQQSNESTSTVEDCGSMNQEVSEIGIAAKHSSMCLKGEIVHPQMLTNAPKLTWTRWFFNIVFKVISCFYLLLE